MSIIKPFAPVRTGLTLAASAVLLAACGGGGGVDGTGTSGNSVAINTSASDPAATGSPSSATGITGGGTTAGTTTGATTGTTSTIKRAALSLGSVTQFGASGASGSVLVNGIEFRSDTSTVLIDDSPSSLSDLRLGMVVRIESDLSNTVGGVPRATAIRIDDSLHGYVESVPDADHLVVMGQSVQLDGNTRYDTTGRPGAGDFVRISSHAVSDGVLHAGYVSKSSSVVAASVSTYGVKGYVSSHDTTARAFMIGKVKVNYGSASVSDMGAGSWNGQIVEVKGPSCTTRPVCTVLTASKVEPNGLHASTSSFDSKQAYETELEGYVSGAVSSSGFVINGQNIALTSRTQYVGGVFTDLLSGSKVEVEGSLSQGVLTATKVSFHESLRLEGDVASVNTSTGELTLKNQPSLKVNVNSLTAYSKVPSLSGVSVGSHVRLRGRQVLSGAIQATELELRKADTKIVVQGPASSFTTNSVTVLGVTVNASSFSESNFTRSNGSSSGSTALGSKSFFAALKSNTIVKMSGVLSGSTLVWKELEIEED